MTLDEEHVVLTILYGYRISSDIPIETKRILIDIMIGATGKDAMRRSAILDRLLLDKHIDTDPTGLIFITDKGANFLLTEGGYIKQSRFKRIDEQIKIKTLKKFGWEKHLSIIAVIISFLSVVFTIYIACTKK